MATLSQLADLALGDTVQVSGTLDALDLSGGRHYDTAKIKLAKANILDEQKYIFVDPVNVDLADPALLARYQAALVLLGLTLEQVEGASDITVDTGTSGHIKVDVTL